MKDGGDEKRKVVIAAPRDITQISRPNNLPRDRISYESFHTAESIQTNLQRQNQQNKSWINKLGNSKNFLIIVVIKTLRFISDKSENQNC